MKRKGLGEENTRKKIVGGVETKKKKGGKNYKEHANLLASLIKGPPSQRTELAAFLPGFERNPWREGCGS